MAIFVEEMSRVIVQGITGRLGADFAERMAADGTRLVGGVTPGRAGTRVADVPVFDSVAQVRRGTGATASLVVVPPAAVREAVIEAAAAGVRLVSVYSEHVPVHDTLVCLALARSFGATVIGPNAAGIGSAGIANMSDIRSSTLVAGPVGIVSKSGTLAYEVIEGLRALGLGTSTVACLGGDRVIGTSFADVLPRFAADAQTELVVLLGEIGGTAELEAARVWNALGRPKQLVAYVAGGAAPAGKRMGHAGAIVAGAGESAAAKRDALAAAGATVVDTVADVAPAAEGLLRTGRRR